MRMAAAAGAGQLAGLRPMRGALARMAAALRTAVAIMAVASAVVGGGAPLTWWWLIPALVVVSCWTAVYVLVAWTRGLRAWLVSVDLALAAALCLAIGKLVPAAAVPGTVSWVSIIASMAVVCAQLAGAPVISVPAGLLVAASAVAGARLAHSPDGGIAPGVLLTSQAVAAAAVMAVALRTERGAVRAFTSLQRAQAAAELAAVQREDERAQLRLVHNGPLTVLTMALHANAERPSGVLRRRAAATLAALPHLTATAAANGVQMRLDERLAQIMAWYEPSLTITADLPPCSVPAHIADAFTGAAAEALENVVRYAGTRRATAILTEADDVVRVTVTDQGRGFDPDRPPGPGFGLREDLAGRMAAAGGNATVHSAPGEGTVVQLEWHRA
jgi:Histidine kinase-, DNA gyrase B-, and HSP90-like ATPase